MTQPITIVPHGHVAFTGLQRPHVASRCRVQITQGREECDGVACRETTQAPPLTPAARAFLAQLAKPGAHAQEPVRWGEPEARGEGEAIGAWVSRVRRLREARIERVMP